MSPRDIITQAVQSIDGIRFPQARGVIERIFSDLAEEGYVIIEESELGKTCPHPSKSTKATSSR